MSVSASAAPQRAALTSHHGRFSPCSPSAGVGASLCPWPNTKRLRSRGQRRVHAWPRERLRASSQLCAFFSPSGPSLERQTQTERSGHQSTQRGTYRAIYSLHARPCDGIDSDPNNPHKKTPQTRRRAHAKTKGAHQATTRRLSSGRRNQHSRKKMFYTKHSLVLAATLRSCREGWPDLGTF